MAKSKKSVGDENLIKNENNNIEEKKSKTTKKSSTKANSSAKKSPAEKKLSSPKTAVSKTKSPKLETSAKSSTTAKSSTSVKSSTVKKSDSTKSESSKSVSKKSDSAKSGAKKTETATKKSSPRKKSVTEKSVEVDEKNINVEEKNIEVKKSPENLESEKSLNTNSNLNTSSALSENLNTSSVLNKNSTRKKIIIVAGIIALILLLGGITFFVLNKNSATKKLQERQNTILLAKRYIEKNQFQSAMDLLNKLLINDANDEEVSALLDEVIEKKSLFDNENNSYSSSNQIQNYSGPQSFDVNINTDEITNAFKSSLDSMSKELSEANRANAEANAKNQEAIKKLLSQKQQEEKRQEEVSKKKEAQKKATEEKEKAEVARKKADEEKQAARQAEIEKEKKEQAQLVNKIDDLINQANANLNTGNYQAAAELFSQAENLIKKIKNNPELAAEKQAEIASSFYDAFEHAKNPDDKKMLLDNAVNHAESVSEKVSTNAKSHFILAMNAEANKDSALAEKELELAVKNDPNNYIYYYYLGRRQFLNKKYQQARTSFIASTKINSNYDSSFYNLGVTCNKLNLSKEALQAFRKAYSINPQHSKAYLEEARILNKTYKDFNASITAYNKVLSIEPDNIAALKECGSVYASVEKFSQAENCFRKVVANLGTKPDPLTYYNLSTVLYNQGKVTDAKKYALESYNTKSTLDTKSQAMIAYNYALVLEKNNELDNAISLYQETLKLNPNHTKAKINLGIMFMEMSPPNVDSALGFLNQAYAEDNNNFEVNNNLGNAYLLKKDFSRAINFYLNATKLNSKDIKVKENLAKAYVESSQFDNAKVIYKDVISQKPDSYDSYIEIAKVCIALKDIVSAEGYLTALQSKRPEYRVSEVKALLDIVKQ